MFAPEFQQEMSYYTEGMRLQGDGKTYSIKVAQGIRWIKNAAAASVRSARNTVSQAYGSAVQGVLDFADLSIDKKAQLLCTLLLAYLTLTAVNWATSMAQEEIFGDTEKDKAEIKRLLQESNGSLEKSLEIFGRIRAVPNAAAVYQRARTVHGLDPQAALQAVSDAYANECPPGATDCKQPNKSMFDTSKPGHQADLTKLAQSGLSRKDQERLMADKISALLSKTNA
jgi:hypothetical protein